MTTSVQRAMDWDIVIASSEWAERRIEIGCGIAEGRLSGSTTYRARALSESTRKRANSGAAWRRRAVYHICGLSRAPHRCFTCPELALGASLRLLKTGLPAANFDAARLGMCLGMNIRRWFGPGTNFVPAGNNRRTAEGLVAGGWPGWGQGPDRGN